MTAVPYKNSRQCLFVGCDKPATYEVVNVWNTRHMRGCDEHYPAMYEAAWVGSPPKAVRTRKIVDTELPEP